MHQKLLVLKIINNNLVGGWLAGTLACEGDEERKLLAQEEIVPVLDEWTEFSSKPLNMYITFTNFSEKKHAFFCFAG